MQGEKKKNICLILPGKLPVPNIKGGAIETLLTLLIDQNEKDGRAHFIVVCAWADGIDEIVQNYKNTEFHFFKIRKGIWKKGINFINYLIAKLTGDIDYFKTPMHYDIENIMKNLNADAVVVEHGIYKHFGFLLKKYDRNQLYLHLHGTGPLPDKKTRETFGNVITVSEFVRDLYKDKYNRNDVEFKVVLNGTNYMLFEREFTISERNQIRKSFKVQQDEFLVIYVGRLVKEKGVKEIIQGIIKCNNPKIKLMIVGSSNFKDGKQTLYVKELKNCVTGHEDQIFFTGYVPNSDLYKYYKSADLQAICSVFEEAAGLVAIEGQLCGLSLLITNSGGLHEYIMSESVRIVDKRNALYDERDSQLLSNDISNIINWYYIQTRTKNLTSTNNLNYNFSASEFYKRFINTIL